jgi:hypothetical protein
VTLVAMPPQEALASAVVGQDIGAAPIGAAKSASGGAYSLAPDTRLGAWRSAHPGATYVNVEVVASTSTGVMSTSTTLTLGTTSSGGATVKAVAGQDVSSEPATLDLQLVPAVGTAAPATVTTTPGVTTAAVQSYSCFTYQRDLGSSRVTVGQLRSTSTAYTGNQTYSAGTRNTLGAGFSNTGGYGSFSASGTITYSADTQLIFGQVANTGTNLFRTEMRYGLYYGTGCSPSNVFYYKALPSAWMGSALTEWNPATPTIGTICGNYVPNNGIVKTSGTNATATAGAATAPLIGINLSSKAEWSTSFQQRVIRTTYGQICGTLDYPGQPSPGVLGVKG